MKNIILTLLIFAVSNIKAQFVFLTVPFSNYANSDFPDSNTYFSYDPLKNTSFRHILAGTIDTNTSNAPQKCPNRQLNKIYSISPGIYNLQNKECIPLDLNYFFSKDKGKTWTQKLLPNGKNASLINVDLGDSIDYFVESNTTNNKKYKFNLKNNSWDSIEFIDTGFSLLTINKGIGIILAASLINTPLKFNLAKTLNGGKTFQLIQNIDYNKVPLNNQNLLKNLIIVSDSFWLINYTDNDLSINGVYVSNNNGNSWRRILNENIQNIEKADDNTAYISSIPFSSSIKGNLYQITENGMKICQTDFHAEISKMKFFNAMNGLILSVDTPNSQHGIWRMTNGGGAPCFIQNIGINIQASMNNNFKIYPNPAFNQLTLINYSSPTKSEYKIYTLLGILVQDGILQVKESVININNLPRGLYFITIGNSKAKFIKE